MRVMKKESAGLCASRCFAIVYGCDCCTPVIGLTRNTFHSVSCIPSDRVGLEQFEERMKYAQKLCSRCRKV